MPHFSRSLIGIAAAATMMTLSSQAHALGCEWPTTPGPLQFTHNIAGIKWVARDAPVGSKIYSTTSTGVLGPGFILLCDNDGALTLTANMGTPLPVAPGTFPPVDGKDVTGKVLQTSIPGVGLYLELGGFLNGVASNTFQANDGGIGAIPYVGENGRKMTPSPLEMRNLIIKYMALIKTGPIPAGTSSFNQEVVRGVVSDVGDAVRLTLGGQVQQAQCTLKANAVSANPVQLGTHDIADFTGQGSTSDPVDFYITLNDCEDDPAGSVARAFMRLNGVDGSVPVDRDLGLFTLTSDSSASGIGIQVLRSDNNPLKLEEFVDMVPLTPGNTRIDLRARYYQTEATVTPGEAKGALNFTIEYR
ncbi:fimbrial protein [Pseudomonas putida]|uniref:Fimbrial protein n=2 Tax=Bacteria TaxID=2 RepID=A0AAW6PYZ4_PSEPU|nr:fimbrial protein [Pseudomonas putida]KWW13394.1 fimbrial protein [Pseudomonas putida]MDF3873657.1 fimbrial protein [Pseudomonas putida]MDF3877062.1 fimbrial protein [Pseudomonas putida]MDQ2483012.1 fimbrial protein [Pseudomonas putida]